MKELSEKESKANYHNQVNYLIARRLIKYVIETKTNNFRQISKALHLTSTKADMILNRLTNLGFIIRKGDSYIFNKKKTTYNISSTLRLMIQKRVYRKSKVLYK